MKKQMIALLLSAVLMTSTAFAAWSPVDFHGGSLSGIVADGETLLVSDVFNKVVWRVTDDGVQQAVGQIGIPGLNGEPLGKYDDGTLETALFMEPWAMTPFLNGYAITDTEANVVRYFDETGVFTAVGGKEAGNQNGTGTSARFDSPTGLATGPDGEVYIADTGNGAIRVMSEKGKVTTLVSGLADPTGLYWADDALYVAETGRSRILRIENGSVEVIAGNGTALGNDEYQGAYVDGPIEIARFDHPQGIAVDEDGAIYVADTGNHAVRKIDEGRVSTLAVSRETPGTPVQPRSILIQSDTLLVTDLFAQTLLEIDLTPVSYVDIPANHWCAEYIYDATERNITGGTGGGYFSPNCPVTRAMLVVMLSRLHQNVDGNAVINGESTFSDVAEDAWCAEAIRWAADLEVVTGYTDGRFGPDDPITRQQLVTILYRYASMMGYDVSAGEDTNILSYTDALSISEYAIHGAQWACREGIVSGYTDGSFKPHGQATRAHTVKILMTAMDAFGI